MLSQLGSMFLNQMLCISHIVPHWINIRTWLLTCFLAIALLYSPVAGMSLWTIHDHKILFIPCLKDFSCHLDGFCAFLSSCLEVSTTLTSMPTRHQVQENVKSVLRGLKIDTSDKGLLEKEEKCLADLQPLFSGIDHVSWSSGLPENN